MKQDRKNAESLFKSLSLDLPSMAEMVKKKGRGRDTVLAHITPEEAKLLKKRGGRGSINPETGLLEFEDFYSGEYMQAPDFTPQVGTSDAYTGGGYAYTPEESSYFSNINVPVSSFAQPETYTPTQSYAQPGIDLSQYSGPGVQSSIGAPGIGFTPQQQATAVPQINLPQVPGGEVAPATGGEPQQSLVDRLTKSTGLSADTLAKLGVGGLSALGGIAQTRKAQQQGQKAKAELQGLAKPYQTQGQELVRQAQAGELTPQSQQAYQAAQAQIQQGIAQRGGVGEAQAATQLASIYNNLLQNQYQTGLQVMGIGDNIAVGAIQTGIQADQYVNNLTQSYFTNIARVIAGQPLGGTTTTTTRTS